MGQGRALGFVQPPTAKPDWVFRHADTDTLLVFSFTHAEEDKVANADFVSTEHFLRTKQLIIEPLVDVIPSFKAAGNR